MEVFFVFFSKIPLLFTLMLRFINKAQPQWTNRPHIPDCTHSLLSPYAEVPSTSFAILPQIKFKMRIENSRPMGSKGGPSLGHHPPPSMAASSIPCCRTGAPQVAIGAPSGGRGGPGVEPRLLIVAGPSGVGKGTLVKRLREYWPEVGGGPEGGGDGSWLLGFRVYGLRFRGLR